MFKKYPALIELDPLFQAFETQGWELYLVGGCVRDLIMGQMPKDFDFATNAIPKAIKSTLKAFGFPIIPIGEDFGTIATRLGHQQVEITTYRVKESYTKGSRHPSVVFGQSLEMDLSRRDLTINAMAMDRHGKVIDPFGGVRDIGAQILRVPEGGLPKTREIFQDDPLRMLRIARFIARYGFEPDASTTRAACIEAHSIHVVSRERWHSEFNRILEGQRVDLGLQWLLQVGVLREIFPQWPDSSLTTPEFWSKLVALRSVLSRWAWMLKALGPVREMGKYLLFSNQKIATLERWFQTLDMLLENPKLDRIQVKKLLLVLGPRARTPAKLMDWLNWIAIHDIQTHGFMEIYQTLKHEQNIEPRLPPKFGQWLMQSLNLQPGPQLGAMIDWVKTEVIEERLPNGADPRVYLKAIQRWKGERSL